MANPDRSNHARNQAERAKNPDPNKKHPGRPYRTPPVDKACGKCGTAIRVYANQLREFNYCGRACYFAHKRESFGTDQCAAPSCEEKVTVGRRYCSRECNIGSRQIAEKIVVLTCAECGDEFPRILRETRAKHRESGLAYCSQPCGRRYAKRIATESRTRPLGATNASTQGYSVIKTEAGWVPEHRAVMERIIDRPVRADEDVHHRNGDRSDNRPENLELWNRSHPRGQRVSDKVVYAIEILKQYSPESLREEFPRSA